MSASLEHLYRTHHEKERGESFVLLGDVRGRFLQKHIGSGKNVLDIGCRDGALTRCFVEGNQVVGVDIDSAALENARKDLGIETKQMDLLDAWGFEDGTFDVVVACEILEHLYYPADIVEKISRVLAPGGMLVGSVPNAFSLKNRLRYLRLSKKHTPLSDPTHINHFTVQELEGMLATHLESVHVEGYGRYQKLASAFPQACAFGLLFSARRPL